MWRHWNTWTAGGNVILQPFLVTVWQFLKKFNLCLPYNLAMPLLQIYPRGLKTYVCIMTCTGMFTAALCTIGPNWKQLKGISTREWINKLWHIHTMEFYYTIKSNVCNIDYLKPLGWVKEARHKSTYCMTPCM